MYFILRNTKGCALSVMFYNCHIHNKNQNLALLINFLGIKRKEFFEKPIYMDGVVGFEPTIQDTKKNVRSYNIPLLIQNKRFMSLP